LAVEGDGEGEEEEEEEEGDGLDGVLDGGLMELPTFIPIECHPTMVIPTTKGEYPGKEVM
jgi:hypothetical protein